MRKYLRDDTVEPVFKAREALLSISVLLRREGWPVNAKRIYLLYKELGFQIRNKTPKVSAKLRPFSSCSSRA